MVTLDRIKKIDVEADFDVWKEYAYQQGNSSGGDLLSGASQKNFYRVENTVTERSLPQPEAGGSPV